MAWDRLPDYLIDIAAAAAAHPEMQVIPGCEIDWLGAQEDRDFSALDFSNFIHVLGSVHYLDGWAFDDPVKRRAGTTWASIPYGVAISRCGARLPAAPTCPSRAWHTPIW